MMNLYLYYIFYSAFLFPLLIVLYYFCSVMETSAKTLLTLQSQQRSFVSESSLYLVWKIVVFNVALQEEISGMCNFCVSCILTGTE